MAICLKDVQDYVQRSKNALEVAATMITHQYWSDAVSKAYYAMFYAANAIILTKGISTSKHSAVSSPTTKRLMDFHLRGTIHKNEHN